jgi:hypothetical protein
MHPRPIPPTKASIEATGARSRRRTRDLASFARTVVYPSSTRSSTEFQNALRTSPAVPVTPPGDSQQFKSSNTGSARCVVGSNFAIFRKAASPLLRAEIAGVIVSANS